MILGLPREDAIVLGKKYQQNAILFGKKWNCRTCPLSIMSDPFVEEQEMGLFFFLTMFLHSFQQRNFFEHDGLQIIDEIHNIMEQWLELHIPSQKRSCMKGCSACCYNNPNGITTFDLWVLYHREYEQLQKQIDKLKANVEFYNSLSSMDRETQQISWLKTKTPCPFLKDQLLYLCKSTIGLSQSFFCLFTRILSSRSFQFSKNNTHTTYPPQDIYAKLFQNKKHPQDLFGSLYMVVRRVRKEITNK